MFAIEFTASSSDPCPCCGYQVVRLDRSLRRGGSIVACYHAEFTDHPEWPQAVAMEVRLWPSPPESDGGTRVGFAFTTFPDVEDEWVNVSVHDAEPWAWHGVGEERIVERLLDREAALAHPRYSDVCAMLRHIVNNDMRIRRYLLREPADVGVLMEAPADAQTKAQA